MDPEYYCSLTQKLAANNYSVMILTPSALSGFRPTSSANPRSRRQNIIKKFTTLYISIDRSDYHTSMNVSFTGLSSIHVANLFCAVFGTMTFKKGCKFVLCCVWNNDI